MEGKEIDFLEMFETDLLSPYNDEGIIQLAKNFNLNKTESNYIKACLQCNTVNAAQFHNLLAVLGIHLTEGLVGAILLNLVGQGKIDFDDFLIDAAAMERYLMYNGCRGGSLNPKMQRHSALLCTSALKHVQQHYKHSITFAQIQTRYEETLRRIPFLLHQYVTAVKTGRPCSKSYEEQTGRQFPQLGSERSSNLSIKKVYNSPYLLSPQLPRDYPPIGERNQDSFELREAIRRKIRLMRSKTIASPCKLMCKNTIAHSNNLHVWSLNDRRKDLVSLPRLTLSELSRHPDNLTIEDATELREKVDFLRLNYYKAYLNATEMGTDQHWAELLGHEITSPTLQQVTMASFLTYSNPKYSLTFSPWAPKPFWMLRRNPTCSRHLVNSKKAYSVHQAGFHF